MINTILFDLDGTLLRFKQDEFIETYFSKLAKVFTKLGLDPQLSVKAVWAGTRAMMQNDGTKPNIGRFWDTFSEIMNINDVQLNMIEAACDLFYTTDFNQVKSIVELSDIPKYVTKQLKDMRYTLVLATNPLFPECGVLSRLGWVDIDPSDFSLITHYANSTFCKPNLGYYLEILSKIGKNPNECLMVGNNPIEDMVVSDLGMQVFLVTDFLEDNTNIDITQFRRGSLSEAELFLLSLPKINDN